MKKKHWIIIGLLLLFVSCGKKSATNSTTNSIDTIKETKEDPDEKGQIDWNGKYAAGDGNELTITNYKRGVDFDFGISIIENTDSDDPCTGEVNGKAKLTDEMHATYSFKSKTDPDDACELKFTFDGQKQIDIEEVDCFYYHGANCDFNNSFTK